MTYIPDKWLLLKMPECYKVFGVWYGGYAKGDSWKLNSGIKKVEEHDKYILFHGYSGSVYHCRKNNYGSSVYGLSVLKGFGDAVEVVSDFESEMSAILEQISCA
jgi:hypothetical protein